MSEFTAERTPVARKHYPCDKCLGGIFVGDEYNYDVGRDEHGFYVRRFCNSCYSITEKHTASSNALKYIKATYGVPAIRGGRVKFEGKPGTIVGGRGAHLRIKLDGEAKAGIYHPRWHIEYWEAT